MPSGTVLCTVGGCPGITDNQLENIAAGGEIIPRLIAPKGVAGNHPSCRATRIVTSHSAASRGRIGTRVSAWAGITNSEEQAR